MPSLNKDDDKEDKDAQCRLKVVHWLKWHVLLEKRDKLPFFWCGPHESNACAYREPRADGEELSQSNKSNDVEQKTLQSEEI